jgi:SAM-dependent methyltransferase
MLPSTVSEPPHHEASAGSSSYALGRDAEESVRLRNQSVELHPQSVALLDRITVPVGGSAIDLGCGPAGVLELLADRVGPSGRIVGLDSDPAHVEMARALMLEREIAAEIVQGNATATGLAPASFDVVHARTLLVNVPDPAAVVAEMARLARPGGFVLLQEPDLAGRICYPPIPEWDRLLEVFVEAFERDGADLHVGRRLPTLLREAGLVDVGVEARADIYPVGHTRRTIRADLARSLRPVILEQGLVDEAELDRLDGAVRSHLANPDVLVVPHLYFLAWGRRLS